MSITISTDKQIFDNFYPQIKTFILNNVKASFIDGKIVKGYKCPDGDVIWLRDHVHQLKGTKYFENNLKNVLDYFLKCQHNNGMIPDLFRKTREKDKENIDLKRLTKRGMVNIVGNILNIRVEVETDVEYHLIDGVHTVWQVTGDDNWMINYLPKLERALNYSLNNPNRWSEEHGLVKRPFTIDTWDFEYNPDGVYGDFCRDFIDRKTMFSIMHGDNSGMYKACRLLGKMFVYSDKPKKSKYWNQKAEEIKFNMNKVCWNGKFYTHQIHITPVEVMGVNENKQLSLSNTYDMNRGVAEHKQCVSIIKEYQRRRKTVNSFAEWFGIDPPFPDGSFHKCWGNKAGEYVNGGIMPLVGGELAKACFEHGFEEYGLDILLRYQKMVTMKQETYLWYHRDGSPGRWLKDQFTTDGWGSSAMLYAFIEGLVGVEDKLKLYQEVRCSPRWAITDRKMAKVMIKYEVSGAYFDYEYKINQNKREITINFNGSGNDVDFHFLMPKGTIAKNLSIDNKAIKWQKSIVEASHYTDFSLRISKNIQKVIINYD